MSGPFPCALFGVSECCESGWRIGPDDLPGEAPQNTQILTGLDPLASFGSAELGLSLESP